MNFTETNHKKRIAEIIGAAIRSKFHSIKTPLQSF